MSENAYLRGVLAIAAQRRPVTVVDAIPDEEPEALVERAVAEVEAVDRGEPVSPLAPRPRVLKSEFAGVSDEAWTDFVLAMKVQDLSTVSGDSYGLFAMKLRRLADLGLVKNLKKVRLAPTNRMAWVGDWVSSETKFLHDRDAQYDAFARSMRVYVDGLRDGSVSQPEGGVPTEMTLSGALAILHRCGPSGLETWNDEANRFEQTSELYARANGIF